MINATKEKLASFFQGTIQYEVPFFQRAYVWDDENWATLWDHVLTVLERHEQGLSGEHFIGTVITKQRPAERLGQQVHDLIDGQQRLTTIALLLQAIADTATGDVPRLKEVISDNLRFRDTRNEVHPRVIPSSYDRTYYNAIMAGEAHASLANGDHKIVRAYRFFRDRLADMTDDRRDQLRLVLLERVSVISMMLSHEDDEQEIFDTINALGVRLTTAELLKNYIFKEQTIQSHYATLWKDVDEDLMITTVLPLALYIYKCIDDAVKRQELLHLLEGYLVRRNVCRLTTKNYNLLFVQIINRLQESRAGSFDVDRLARIIGGFGEDTNRMPTDEDLASAFRSEQLSNQNSREILFLLALRQVSDGLADVQKLSLGNYTVEHMMPVKWEANWLDREMSAEEKANRGRKLRTLGNLTLVTKRLNSRMQNAAWKDKKTHLRRYASLPLTASYLDRENWDESAIDERAVDLVTTARSVWGSDAGS